MLASKCQNPKSQVQWRWDLKLSFTPSSQTPHLHSRSISLPSQMAGKYDPYDEQTIFQKCTCALAKSKSGPPPKKTNRFGRRFFFLEPPQKKETGRKGGWLESVRCMGQKKSSNFSGRKAHRPPSGRSKNGDGFFSWLMGHKAEDFAWDVGGTKRSINSWIPTKKT